MCGRFEVLGWDEVAEVVRVLEAVSPVNVMSDWPARLVGVAGAVPTDAVPGSAVDVVVADSRGVLSAACLTWGFAAEWSQRPVYNTRLEKAMGPNPGMWAGPISRGRCVVPARGFFETHATETVRSPKTGRNIKRRYRFGAENEVPLLLAGVRDETCFSVVTTSPNAVVSPVHDRMPLVLSPQEAVWWLRAPWPDFANGWHRLANRGDVALTSRPAQPAAPQQNSPFEQTSLF